MWITAILPFIHSLNKYIFIEYILCTSAVLDPGDNMNKIDMGAALTEHTVGELDDIS
jgi:hypothetical protein